MAPPCSTDQNPPVGDGSVRHVIANDDDIVAVRRTGRRLAKMAGFPVADLTMIVTAISEVARNIISYAEQGAIVVRVVTSEGRRGLEVVAEDEGPGIADVERALEDGYSTGRGMGLGLPGARRLMDELQVDSTVGVGTKVVMRKWVVVEGSCS
jgi:serine/threonine-protein kinase RsbT